MSERIVEADSQQDEITPASPPARVRYGVPVVSSLKARAAVLANSPDLRAELACMRVLAEDAVDAYDTAVQDAMSAGVPPTQLQRIKLSAGSIVSMALERVRDMAVAQAKISSSQFIAIPDLAELCQQLVGIVDAELSTRAGDLRMIGLDPSEFMGVVAERLREATASIDEAMCDHGPAGNAGYGNDIVNATRVRELVNDEAARMDDTIPEVA